MKSKDGVYLKAVKICIVSMFDGVRYYVAYYNGADDMSIGYSYRATKIITNWGTLVTSDIVEYFRSLGPETDRLPHFLSTALREPATCLLWLAQPQAEGQLDTPVHATSVCTCETVVLMNRGCPSARGGPCPGLKLIDINPYAGGW